MPKNGHVTPSNFSKIMTMAQYKKILKDKKEVLEFSVTAQKYAVTVCRGFLGVEDREITARALEHGKTYEPVAREAYEFENMMIVAPIIEPIHHPKFRFVCGMPDGLVGDDGILEIKCPENPDNHFMNVTEGMQIEEYYAQIQGYMWITGRKWCDFVSYHPYYPKKHRLCTHYVDRDEVYIDVLERKILSFFNLVLDTMKQFSVEESENMKKLSYIA